MRSGFRVSLPRRRGVDDRRGPGRGGGLWPAMATNELCDVLHQRQSAFEFTWNSTYMMMLMVVN